MRFSRHGFHMLGEDLGCSCKGVLSFLLSCKTRVCPAGKRGSADPRPDDVQAFYMLSDGGGGGVPCGDAMCVRSTVIPRHSPKTPENAPAAGLRADQASRSPC